VIQRQQKCRSSCSWEHTGPGHRFLITTTTTTLTTHGPGLEPLVTIPEAYQKRVVIAISTPDHCTWVALPGRFIQVIPFCASVAVTSSCIIICAPHTVFCLARNTATETRAGLFCSYEGSLKAVEELVCGLTALQATPPLRVHFCCFRPCGVEHIHTHPSLLLNCSPRHTMSPWSGRVTVYHWHIQNTRPGCHHYNSKRVHWKQLFASCGDGWSSDDTQVHASACI